MTELIQFIDTFPKAMAGITSSGWWPVFGCNVIEFG
jgi:hypothetical protein